MSLNSDLSEVYELYVILFYVIIISRVLNLLSVHHPEDAGKKKNHHQVCDKLWSIQSPNSID